MRILVWLVVSGMAACASREAPRPPVPQARSAWALDKQPIPDTLDEALEALQRGLGEPTIARTTWLPSSSHRCGAPCTTEASASTSRLRGTARRGARSRDAANTPAVA